MDIHSVRLFWEMSRKMYTSWTLSLHTHSLSSSGTLEAHEVNNCSMKLDNHRNQRTECWCSEVNRQAKKILKLEYIRSEPKTMYQCMGICRILQWYLFMCNQPSRFRMERQVVPIQMRGARCPEVRRMHHKIWSADSWWRSKVGEYLLAASSSSSRWSARLCSRLTSVPLVVFRAMKAGSELRCDRTAE